VGVQRSRALPTWISARLSSGFVAKEGGMPPLVRDVIGDVLRCVRMSQGRTLREVSDSARVSLGYLSEVERGRKEASSELLNAICDALDVPLSSILIGAAERMAGKERAAFAACDAGARVVIPPVAPLAVA
jgi:predicted transcriptional regulator